MVKKVFARIAEISERLKTTIMIVEHNIKGVLDIVDRAYVLEKGRAVFTGTPTATRSSNILTQVHLGTSGAT